MLRQKPKQIKEASALCGDRSGVASRTREVIVPLWHC